MGAECGECGTRVVAPGVECPRCHVPVGAPARVHVVPDIGLQTYVDPYPPMHAGSASRRELLSGGRAVTVVSVRGDWVQVSVDGVDAGWVDGRRLVPPAAVPMFNGNGHSSGKAPAPAAASGSAVTLDLFASVLASAGLVLGAVLSWTQGISANAFEIPLEFLFNPHTTSRNPRLGWVLLVIGVLGLVVSFLRAARWQVALGALAVAGALAYMGQIAAALPPHASFTDVIGAGPWVTLVAGVGLMFSPMLRPGYA